MTVDHMKEKLELFGQAFRLIVPLLLGAYLIIFLDMRDALKALVVSNDSIEDRVIRLEENQIAAISTFDDMKVEIKDNGNRIQRIEIDMNGFHPTVP